MQFGVENTSLSSLSLSLLSFIAYKFIPLQWAGVLHRVMVQSLGDSDLIDKYLKVQRDHADEACR